MRSAATVLLLLCLGALSGPGRAQAPPATVTVTTDSADYCDSLARRRPSQPTAEVARLWREGKTMCDEGHVRSGIMQLRRALLLARGEASDAP